MRTADIPKVIDNLQLEQFIAEGYDPSRVRLTTNEKTFSGKKGFFVEMACQPPLDEETFEYVKNDFEEWCEGTELMGSTFTAEETASGGIRFIFT